VFFNRSEIVGKKEPIISEAWILLICFPNDNSFEIGSNIKRNKTNVFTPINPKNKLPLIIELNLPKYSKVVVDRKENKKTTKNNNKPRISWFL